MPEINIPKAPTQGLDVLFEVSVDNGTTWKTLVCLSKQGWQKQRATNDVNTQCGPFVGIGPKTQTVPVEGVVSEVPPTGYVSYAELNGYIDSSVAIMVRQKGPGTTPSINNEGKAYLTDLNIDIPIDNIATFTGTFKVF